MKRCINCGNHAPFHYICDNCIYEEMDREMKLHMEMERAALQRKTGMKGNQFGLTPGDRVALSEDTNGRVCDMSWYNGTKVVNGTVIGYDQYGYPVVCFDAPHKRSGFALTEMRKNNNAPDQKEFEKQERSCDVSESGRCFVVYAEAAYRRLDPNGKPIRPTNPVINYGLVAGDKVTVSYQNGRINDQRWGGSTAKATVIGCNEEGAPILMLDESAMLGNLGWPLLNILNEDGTPRIDCTLAKSMRQTLAGTDFKSRRCFYIYTKDAFQRETKAEAEAPMTDVSDKIKKNFGLDFGDRVSFSKDRLGVNFEYNEAGEKIEGTVIGFRKDDGTPVVVFDTANGESGWPLTDVLTSFTKTGARTVGNNIIADPSLVKKFANNEEVASGDYTYYIGNAETFKKITVKGKKEKSMAQEKDYGPQDEAPSATKKMMSRIKKSAAKTPYRLARMQALTNGKTAILNSVKDRLEPNSFAMLEGILNSDGGAGAILAIIGIIGPMVPKAGQDPRVQGLCEEFLDEGMAKGANEVFNLAVGILAPALMSAVAMLPPVAEAVEERASKQKKARVADVASAPAEESEEEESEEEDEEPASGGKRLSTK